MNVLMKNSRHFLLFSGIVLLVVSFFMAFYLNLPTAGRHQISFITHYDGKQEVKLKGSYWAVKDSEYAVLICPGYSCDRQKWRPVADLCVKNGFSTMTFDYTGQGASMGVIGFDNAKTDRIPMQIADAIEELHQLSGVDYDHIILMGHSMGGRSILRLLYDYNNSEAVTTIQKRKIGNVILISPEVNYHYNAQASFFAGTSDAQEEPWMSYSEKNVEGTDVWLFGSSADDIVSDKDVLAIYAHLGGNKAPESGTFTGETVNGTGSRITCSVIGGVLHSYQMYSWRFADMINEALAEISGKSSVYPAKNFCLIYVMWFMTLAGLFCTLTGLSGKKVEMAEEIIPVLGNGRKYLLFKLIMWLPGTVAAVLICCLCVCMPFGSPVMNIPYMCFIAGYGIVMILFYRKGHFPGTSGKLPALAAKVFCDRKEGMKVLLTTAGLCLVVWYVLGASMYRLIPLNFRLFWVLLATILMAAGYYVSGVENDMLRNAGASRWLLTGYNLIQYIPLFLLVGFYLLLKSYSGMIGQAQNMVLMYVFCIPLGGFISRRTGSRLWGAVSTAFLFQTLMITSAALISMF